MNKITMLLCALALGFSSINAQGVTGQSENVSNVRVGQQSSLESPLMAREWANLYTTNYTATDIYGKTYSFDEILRSGKHLLIDFSWVNCGPCWDIHTGGYLEKIQEAYKDNLLVLWVESKGASKETIENKGGETKGDWTNGGKPGIPLISDKDMAGTLGVNVGWFPWFVFVDLDGSYVQIATKDIKRGPSGIKVLMDESMKVYGEPCISSVDYSSPIAGRKIFFSSVIKPFGINVSYEWTFEGKGTSTEKQPAVVWDNPGSYSFSLKVTDNASKKSVEYHGSVEVTGDGLITKYPYIEGFEENPITGWTAINVDADEYNWITIQDLFKTIKPNYTDEDIIENEFVYDGSNSYTSWSYYPTSFDSKTGFSGNALSTDQILVSPRFDLKADRKYSLQFSVRSVDPKNHPDKLGVFVSTRGIEAGHFSETLLEMGEIKGSPRSAWSNYTLSLNNFVGKKIYIGFRHQDTAKMGVIIDNIIVNEEGGTPPITGTEQIDNNSISVNPRGGVIYVDGKDLMKAELIDMNGRIVAYSNEDTPIMIDAHNLPAGVYLVRGYLRNGAYTLSKIIL